MKARLIRHQATEGAPIGPTGKEEDVELIDSLVADLERYGWIERTAAA